MSTEREQFEEWLTAIHPKNPMLWNTGDAMFAAWQASRPQAPASQAPSSTQPPVSDLLVWAVEDGVIRMSKVMDIDLQDALVKFARRFATPAAAPAPEGETAQDLLILQRFMASVFGDFPEHGDIDGFALQEIATECGLLKSELTTSPCGETCSCADCGVTGETLCYRVQPVMKRARRAANQPGAESAACNSTDGKAE